MSTNCMTNFEVKFVIIQVGIILGDVTILQPLLKYIKFLRALLQPDSILLLRIEERNFDIQKANPFIMMDVCGSHTSDSTC